MPVHLFLLFLFHYFCNYHPWRNRPDIDIGEIIIKILADAFARRVKREKSELLTCFYPGAAQNESLNIFPYEKKIILIFNTYMSLIPRESLKKKRWNSVIIFKNQIKIIARMKPVRKVRKCNVTKSTVTSPETCGFSSQLKTYHNFRSTSEQGLLSRRAAWAEQLTQHNIKMCLTLSQTWWNPEATQHLLEKPILGLKQWKVDNKQLFEHLIPTGLPPSCLTTYLNYPKAFYDL